MRFKNWHRYHETHSMISKLNQTLMDSDYFNIGSLSANDRKTYYEYYYIIGDFDRLPVFDKFPNEFCGVSITAKRELPKAYLRGLLNIFKLISFCANKDIEHKSYLDW